MMLMRLGLIGVLLTTGCLSRPLTEVSPETHNYFVDQVKQTAIDKIDLLFMIDNSASMTDKQEILRDAVPVLLSRLVSPICLDSTGKPTGATTEANGQCAPGKGRPEFNPVGDIHIGIVTSSLGAHGGQQCAEVIANNGLLNPNDKAHLIGGMRPDRFALAKTWDNSGFLSWDSSGKATPPGTADAGALVTVFQDMIGAVGEAGCGYEASLESWYRFLVDPEPPANVTKVGDFSARNSKLSVNADGSTGACVGCDDVLLAQRKRFLRPDSLVAIVMLSDENDCSIRDDGSGWFVATYNNPMPRSSSQCDANPNDRCCRSCAQKEPDGPPDGCAALTADPICKNVVGNAEYATWADPHDSISLRCYDQRRRFGFDLLYQTSRYVDALTKPMLELQSTSGKFVKNPLLDGGASGRDRDASLVFLAGIVGVPWQDIADDASLAGPGLKYLTAKELNAKGRWRSLLGEPQASPPLQPTDPFMRETPGVRSGTNAIAGVSISPATSTNPHENPINGHEQNLPKEDDLQYACTFRLKTPRTCGPEEIASNSSLCEPGAGGMIQTSAKAYPGTRELSVLQALGDNAIVASICPKVIEPVDPRNPAGDANYGYNPAVSAIVERLKTQLAGKCLPRTLKADDQGQALCRVVEAQGPGKECNCKADGRAKVTSDDITRAVLTQLAQSGECGNEPGQTHCSDWCMCEIQQVDPAHLKACQTNQGGVPPGYCYIDDQAKVGAAASDAQLIEEQLARCPANQRHQLRFVDADATHKTPAQGAFAFIACIGEALASGSPKEP
jgi:hypothetical protein